MPEPKRIEGDEQLIDLFEQFEGRLVTPGGAAHLLGISRKTVHTLGERGVIRVYRNESPAEDVEPSGARWAYIPLVDVRDYADKVGRPFPRMPFGEYLPDDS
jgi:hypothetical protein